MTTERDLRALAASGAAGLCSWTLGRDHARITAADDSFLALVGYTRAGFMETGGLDWRLLTPPDWTAALDESFAALLESGSHGPREQEIYTRSGDRVPVLISSAFVDAATGAATSLCVDLTMVVRGRNDAERATRAQSRFLGVMSHELRTPLSSIMGQTELLSDGIYGPLSDGQREAIARVTAASAKLRSLVDEVLLFSRLETGVEQFSMSDVPLAAALATAATAIDSRLTAKGLTFELETPPPSLLVYADAEKLETVLLALLSNAIKFTPAGGRIMLNTVERHGNSDYVFVRVTDSGTGVARERFELIFEPFVQMDEGLVRSASGLGLGLAISRDIARGMGGDLRVRSIEGGGSTFTLSLRRAGLVAG